MPAMSVELATKPYADQKPGTSGLRKRVTVFEQENYMANFVQSVLNAVRTEDGLPDTLVVGGDGRYYSTVAIQIILKIAAGNGVRRVWVGQDGLLSTPAVSAVMRRREGGFKAQGAFILTASHNPGGPQADFGVKWNSTNGGPAPEKLTAAIYAESLKIDTIRVQPRLPEVDIHTLGTREYEAGFTVEVIDPLEDYVSYMQEIFDFAALRRLCARPDFTMHIDSLHGASGPYVRAIFHDHLHVPLSALHNTQPLPDFCGAHPDPNLTYARDLVEAMGLLCDGCANPAMARAAVPAFGAAFDGDADRNMILGSRFFVNPSDAVAVLAAYANVVPFFARQGGLRAVARSMPTSGALDRVAKEKGLAFFEVPTGWKFFGNLMDSAELYHGANYNPLICGEESFGTGSSHIREKDGVWAALFWLSVLAEVNHCGGDHAEGKPTTTPTTTKPLVGVEEVVGEHWAHYGRCYYSRYDYENVTSEAAEAVMAAVLATTPSAVPPVRGQACVKIDNFTYTDPVDHSVAERQGVRVLFADGSRFVLRLSGTGSSGATIRLYLEQYMPAAEVREHLQHRTLPSPSVALKELIAVALQVSAIATHTGRDAPTVIT